MSTKRTAKRSGSVGFAVKDSWLSQSTSDTWMGNTKELQQWSLRDKQLQIQVSHARGRGNWLFVHLTADLKMKLYSYSEVMYVVKYNRKITFQHQFKCLFMHRHGRDLSTEWVLLLQSSGQLEGRVLRSRTAFGKAGGWSDQWKFSRAWRWKDWPFEAAKVTIHPSERGFGLSTVDEVKALPCNLHVA